MSASASWSCHLIEYISWNMYRVLYCLVLWLCQQLLMDSSYLVTTFRLDVLKWQWSHHEGCGLSNSINYFDQNQHRPHTNIVIFVTKIFKMISNYTVLISKFRKCLYKMIFYLNDNNNNWNKMIKQYWFKLIQKGWKYVHIYFYLSMIKWIYIYTVKCRYNAVQYSKILHT